MVMTVEMEIFILFQQNDANNDYWTNNDTGAKINIIVVTQLTGITFWLKW